MDKKRLVAGAAAAVALCVGGGVAYAAGGGSQEQAQGSEMEQAKSIALEHVNGGRVTETEVGDEEGYYEIEVTREDGNQVDVHLDKNLDVLSSPADQEDPDDKDEPDDG